MFARCLSLFVLGLVGVAQAAPVPFQKGTDLPEVQLTGSLPDVRLAAGAPQLIVSQAVYQSVGKAWGITKLPKVDFRTSFLVVTTSRQYLGQVRYNLDRSGDLRPVVAPGYFKCEMPHDAFHFRIKSFRREHVRTVNGDPLPRK